MATVAKKTWWDKNWINVMLVGTPIMSVIVTAIFSAIITITTLRNDFDNLENNMREILGDIRAEMRKDSAASDARLNLITSRIDSTNTRIDTLSDN